MSDNFQGKLNFAVPEWDFRGEIFARVEDVQAFSLDHCTKIMQAQEDEEVDGSDCS